MIEVVAVAPGSVNTALQPLRMARMLDRYRDTAHMALEPWIVEAALVRLDRHLSITEQVIVLRATRTPAKVKWPDWWKAKASSSGHDHPPSRAKLQCRSREGGNPFYPPRMPPEYGQYGTSGRFYHDNIHYRYLLYAIGNQAVSFWAVTGTVGGIAMPLWQIRPVASQNDPRWQGRRIWKEVIVQAKSAAFARLIASELDKPAVPYRSGNESLCFRSGFEDERLYWVRRLDAADAASYETPSGRDGVLIAVQRTHQAESEVNGEIGERVAKAAGIYTRTRYPDEKTRRQWEGGVRA